MILNNRLKLKCLQYVYSGFVDNDKICDYQKNRAKYVKKGKGVWFQTAIRHMDEYIKDPKAFFSHVAVECVGPIKIKTEHQIDNSLGIGNDVHQYSESSANSKHEWEATKEKLVQQIVDLKAENHRIALSLKQSESESAIFLLEKQKMMKDHLAKEESLSERINELQKLNLEIRTMFDEKKQNDAKTISELSYENKSLQARIKQFQSGIMQHQSNANTESSNDTDDDNVFEVEAITKHKENKNGRSYFVRWKGFDRSHDSWLKEANLNCPKILNKYKRSKGLK